MKSHPPRVTTRWDGTHWVFACIWCHRTHRHGTLGWQPAQCRNPEGRAYRLARLGQRRT